jgi:hypothetical protein
MGNCKSDFKVAVVGCSDQCKSEIVYNLLNSKDGEPTTPYPGEFHNSQYNTCKLIWGRTSSSIIIYELGSGAIANWVTYMPLMNAIIFVIDMKRDYIEQFQKLRPLITTSPGKGPDSSSTLGNLKGAPILLYLNVEVDKPLEYPVLTEGTQVVQKIFDEYQKWFPDITLGNPVKLCWVNSKIKGSAADGMTWLEDVLWSARKHGVLDEVLSIFTEN